jgi:hypothetical protein
VSCPAAAARARRKGRAVCGWWRDESTGLDMGAHVRGGGRFGMGLLASFDLNRNVTAGASYMGILYGNME